MDLVRIELQRSFSNELSSSPIIETETSSSSLFASIFYPVRDDGSAATVLTNIFQ